MAKHLEHPYTPTVITTAEGHMMLMDDDMAFKSALNAQEAKALAGTLATAQAEGMITLSVFIDAQERTGLHITRTPNADKEPDDKYSLTSQKIFRQLLTELYPLLPAIQRIPLTHCCDDIQITNIKTLERLVEAGLDVPGLPQITQVQPVIRTEGAQHIPPAHQQVQL